MAVNKFFRNVTATNEQDLSEALTIESIRQYGIDVRYLPRSNGNLDQILGDDYATSYTTAAEVEVLVKSVEGFEGPKDLMSKFGLQIQDQIRFVIAKKRFEQIATEKLLTERGWNLLLQDGGMIQLEDGTGDAYTITSSRPLEGDLIFVPMMGKLFEIKHVESETLFWQFGRLLTYELFCELYSISNEKLETGITAIDTLDDIFNTNELDFNVLLETGDNVLLETGDYLVLDDLHIENFDATANNDDFRREAVSMLALNEASAFGVDA
jgi:hypothetical protein